MTDLPHLTVVDICNWTDPQSYGRGERYYYDGHILNPRRLGSTLKASCIGSRPQPYRVEITLMPDGIARGEQLRVQGAYASAAEMKRIVSQLREGRLCGAQAGQGAPYGPTRGAAPTPAWDAGGLCPEARLEGLGQRVIETTKRWVTRLPALAGAERS